MFAARQLFVGRVTAVAALLILVATGNGQAPTAAADERPLVTIKEAMEMTITPATNTLWGAPEQPTDEEWLALEQASITLLVAADVVGRGGAGPKDTEWARNPAYAAFNKVMANAGLDALKAARARDRDALAAAGDVLYPPCEGCHLQFNPGVTGEK